MNLIAHRMGNGEIHWVVWNPEEVDSISIRFPVEKTEEFLTESKVLRSAKALLEQSEKALFSFNGRSWIVNLSDVREKFVRDESGSWMVGLRVVEPVVEISEESVFGRKRFDAALIFEIKRGDGIVAEANIEPVEISESLQKFRAAFPDPSKVAFIIMQFGNTPAHAKIVSAIKKGFSSAGISALRADDKAFHEDLFLNVQTYMHGCGYGIAVFERLESEAFNPNVALEVGYMMALRRKVCLLKDSTLRSLHTDLIAKIYRPFDPQDPEGTIPLEISKWLEGVRS